MRPKFLVVLNVENYVRDQWGEMKFIDIRKNGHLFVLKWFEMAGS